MLVQAIPLFQDAHLLRRSMLEALSDSAFLTNQLLYEEYSDGILAGCRLTTTKDAIILNEGVVLYGGQLFLIKEPMIVNYYPTNVLKIVRLEFSDEMRDANFIYREMNLTISERKENRKGEMELCRFTLQEGAVLRYLYRNFEDRNTVYDTLNQVYVPYAAKGGSTLSPEITESFAREMLDIPTISEWDAVFLMQILSQSEPVRKEALVTYLKRKGMGGETDDWKRWENHEIYEGLLKILKKELGEVKVKDGERPKKWRVHIE
ncbi:MAG: hypothetical protein ACI4AQ_06975 [Lachnospiraceae bacterium]